jgi:hypothetical protein
MRQSIKHVGDRFEIESENPVETRTDMIIADGVTQRSAKTAGGDMMTWTARVEGDVLVVDGHGDLGHRVIRREIVEGSMVMTIINPDTNTHSNSTSSARRRNEGVSSSDSNGVHDRWPIIDSQSSGRPGAATLYPNIFDV